MRYSKHSSDEILIEGCQRSDRLAQKCLYEKYFGRLFGIGMRYGSNKEEALDILNQGFFKVFNSISKFENKGSFEGWLKRIVFNTAIDYVRKITSYNKRMDFNTIREQSIDNHALAKLNMDDLFKLIQQLPPAMRSVFCLHAIDGYKHHEIAQILGISDGTSKWHLAKARKRLQVLIRERQHKEEVML